MREKKNWMPSEKKCEEILSSLVRIDTCQPEGNEERLIDWIIERLPQKAEYTRISHGAGRASLVVKIAGESEKGGIALIGHVDTVTCGNVDEWKDPPHQAVIRDGKLYGRGASDMKGGDAAMLLTLEQLCGEELRPEKPIYFCFTADEENQGVGIRAMADGGLLNTVDEVMICEPSDSRISICEKGALWLDVSVNGVSSHASRPDLGVNAVEAAYTFAEQIKQFINEKKSHPILGAATASVTRLTGGIMTNMIPPHAELEMDIRTVPGISHRDILAYAKTKAEILKKQFPGIRLDISVANDRPAVETGEDNPSVRRILKLAGEMGMDPAPRGTYFYTDASQLIPVLPVPFVIAGPGDDKLAHCTDEYVEISSVALFSGFYYRYIVENYIQEE